jgi:hypothetical protein
MHSETPLGETNPKTRIGVSVYPTTDPGQSSLLKSDALFSYGRGNAFIALLALFARRRRGGARRALRFRVSSFLTKILWTLQNFDREWYYS